MSWRRHRLELLLKPEEVWDQIAQCKVRRRGAGCILHSSQAGTEDAAAVSRASERVSVETVLGRGRQERAGEAKREPGPKASEPLEGPRAEPSRRSSSSQSAERDWAKLRLSTSCAFFGGPGHSQQQGWLQPQPEMQCCSPAPLLAAGRMELRLQPLIRESSTLQVWLVVSGGSRLERSVRGPHELRCHMAICSSRVPDDCAARKPRHKSRGTSNRLLPATVRSYAALQVGAAAAKRASVER